MADAKLKLVKSVADGVKDGKYIYGIIESWNEQAGLPERPKSFGSQSVSGRGEEVQTIWFDGIGAVVSTSPLGTYKFDKEKVRTHAIVLESVMTHYTVLPVRYGVVADSEASILKLLEKEHEQFITMLESLRGKKELGLKAIFNEAEIYKNILTTDLNIRNYKEKLEKSGSKNPNQLMQIGQMVEAALEVRKADAEADILAALKPLAEDTKLNAGLNERMIINAAFLIRNEVEPAFDTAVNTLADKYAGLVNFKYVGTIPPYNFVTLNIKLEA